MSNNRFLRVLHYLTVAESCSDNTELLKDEIYEIIRAQNYETFGCSDVSLIKSRFERLPINIIHHIFKTLDKLSLIHFALAFPDYEKMIIQPIYWSKLIIKNNILNSNEVKILISHMNKLVKNLTIDFEAIKPCKSNSWLLDIFKRYRNNHLSEANNLIRGMCSSVKELKYLDIKFNNLNDNHLFDITNNLTKLETIFVQSELKIDNGLIYL